MGTTYFIGGIHPPENKITAGCPIETFPVPAKVLLPLSQHIGAPCEALVKAGDMVEVGQKIAQGRGYVSAPVHASVSGQVKSIEPYLHPIGRQVSSIVIETDTNQPQEWANSAIPLLKLLSKDTAALRDQVQDAGIVGLGGATFPTHVKLNPPVAKPVDTLLINGAECEPYLTADHRMMMEHPQELVSGIQLLAHILGISQAYIGIEENKPDAIAALREAATKIEAKGLTINVVKLRVRYPQGSEKHLIQTILDRQVPPPPGLPMDVGVVVQNVGTVYAVYEALSLGKPLIERTVTVTGSGVRQPKNLKVRLGTQVSELLDFCDWDSEGAGKIILGGPMMGMAQYTPQLPVIKGTSGVLVQTRAEVNTAGYRDCVRCGKCVEVCPMFLMPQTLSIYAERGMFKEAEEYGLTDCILCGCCSYVCPAKRPIVQMVGLLRSLKAAAKAKG